MRRAIVYRRSWWASTTASNVRSRSRARAAVRASSGTRSAVSISVRNPSRAVTVASPNGTSQRATIAPMGHDDRYDDLIASLGGFHRSWLIYLGIELGLFGRVRAARETGLTTSELATATATHPDAIEAWAWASDAHDLTTFDDGRLVMDEDVAAIL